MTYRIDVSPRAAKQIRKLDQQRAKQVLRFLDGIPRDNPMSMGKALKGPLGAYWRYRTGDFRIFATIDHGVLLVSIIEVTDRKDAY